MLQEKKKKDILASDPETSTFYQNGQVNPICNVPHSIEVSMNNYYAQYFS